MCLLSVRYDLAGNLNFKVVMTKKTILWQSAATRMWYENICAIYKDTVVLMQSQVMLWLGVLLFIDNEMLFSVEVSENKDVTFS